MTSWASPDDEGREDEYSRGTYDIQPHADVVRLTVTREDLADGGALSDVATGWPAVLSSLNPFIETGSPLPQEPWLVPSR